jgi:hypothetical protein
MGAAGAGASSAIAVLLALALLAPADAAASSTQESILQDDNQLIYSSPDHVERTLKTLVALGVDRARITIVWAAIAPRPLSSRRPHFDATNPDAYPPGAWAHYDLLVRSAQALGLALDFNLTAPAPYWAATAAAPGAGFRPTYSPSAKEFGAFVTAVGRRYDGSFVARGQDSASMTLPPVTYWSIWNEPNEGGWLTPQWRRIGPGRYAPASPAIYRALVDAGWRALRRTGHGADTILIGETAAKGATGHGVGYSMRPMPFLRALYCVDSSYRPLSGSAAALVSCPTRPNLDAFSAAHPGLFSATGYAHHPYSFHAPPQVPTADANSVTLADLPRLERALDRLFAAYGQKTPGGLPLYITEYGYKSNPPNPFADFSQQQQATFINEGAYMAYRDPRVRAFAQFLLVDDRPRATATVGSRSYWSTFQTGLIGFDGKPKPAYTAFRMPLWVPAPRHGQRVAIWGQLRLAQHAAMRTAAIEYRPQGQHAFSVLRLFQTADPRGFFIAHAALVQPGSVRLAWREPLSGRLFRSRTIAIR